MRPCWPQNLKKNDLENKAKNTLKKGVGGNGGRILGVLNTTENNLQNRDTGKENTLSQLALWRIIIVIIIISIVIVVL